MNRITLIVLFWFVITSIYGQSFGIYYTKNGAEFTGDKPQGFRIAYDQGFALGGFVDLVVAPDVELSIQPGYQKLQSTIKVPDTDNPDNDLKDTLDFRLDYVSLPLLFKIHPVKSERFYFITGPNFGFLLESKTTNDLGEETDRSDLINDFNVSLCFGLGYKIPIKTMHLLLEARYEQGLVNITDYGNAEELFSRVKTRGVNLTVGFALPYKSGRDE